MGPHMCRFFPVLNSTVLYDPWSVEPPDVKRETKHTQSQLWVIIGFLTVQKVSTPMMFKAQLYFSSSQLKPGASSMFRMYFSTCQVFGLVLSSCGVTGKFGLGVQNEAGQRLIEFCQENALVIANTLFQQHKRRLHMNITRWSTPKSD